ncbi:hypothetical protein AX768_29885 (plasmid) [Burkholderia sp. PAMC 28687]|uniref:Mobile element protein n=1 Tax=Caballeronia sordidicola TaxID=196367 RepID=A0A242M5E4_CABSO|nr:Tn3 family transposase [Caballeronia sordidicola]AMM18473.1 hypothetical protein AX768_29885 [Burkholderia sp. PAMC 28687]OTP66416.1 Mobile element protein [Caballeronia sordidicola]
MVSLAQKDVSQATLVRKLSSYTRQNQTKKALWELNNLCRTRHILRFINDVNLRQAVQKALNRGEAYHRLRRAISYVNSGKTARQHRSRAADVERLLPSHRERHHPLQHDTAVARP